MQMTHFLEKRASLTPERIALIGNGEQLTFAELRSRARITAQRLASLGVTSGDCVAFLCVNGLHVPELIHATPYIGATLLPLNTRLTAHELAFQLGDAKCRLLIYDEVWQEQVIEIQQRIPSLKCMAYSKLAEIVVEPSGPDDSYQAQSDQKHAKTDDFISDRTTSNLQTEIDMQAVHTIMYTSGTTGTPKGVLITYDNHWSSAIGSVLNLGLTELDRWLVCVPLFHISGVSIVMRSVIYGMSIVIHDKFEPATANQAIINDGVTIVSVVSNMLSRLMEQLDDQTYPDTFRCMLLGGGPAPLPLLQTCVEKDVPVFQTYGMTETASQIVTLQPEYMLTKLGSAGKPLFQAQLRIVQVGEEDIGAVQGGKAARALQYAPPLVPGEILVRGPSVTAGYLNRPEATEEAILNGWLRTGDVGYLDEEGFLYVLDRRKDMFISGGENVYPAEIESVLESHPGIVEAGVTGMEHDQWGQTPVAFICLDKDVELSEDDVVAFCKERLAKYKVPYRIYVVDKLPRNALNKLLRRELSTLIP